MNRIDRIDRGKKMNPLQALLDGDTCSWFLPASGPKTARKSWIGGSLKAKGKLVVDDGALAALKAGRSLLPAGITRVEGRFERGDAVLVVDAQGNEIARGLAAYDAADAKLIMGHKSKEIAALLSYRGRDEMIHRDELVVS